MVLRLANMAASLRRQGDRKICFFGPEGTLERTHTEFELDSRRVAVWLLRRGVSPGSRVGILAKNSYEWLVLDVSILRMGAISVAFHANYFTSTAVDLVAANDLALFVVESALLPGTGAHPALASMAEVQDLLGRRDDSAFDERPECTQDVDIVTVNFTSGTTGVPKAVEVRRSAAEDFIRFVHESAQLGPDDCLLGFLPMSVFSQRLMTYGAFLAGFDAVLTTHDYLARALQRYKPTIMQAVPHFFESIAKSMAMDGDSQSRRYKLSKLFGPRMRYLLTGSAPISRAALETFESSGHRIYEGYGSNETGLIAFNTPAHHRLGSVGRPVPGKEIRLDEQNQVLVRGPHTWASRYLDGSEELNGRTFRADGFIATGDVGEFDADGFLYLRGRIKDVINLSNGLKADPGTLEAMLVGRPGIEQAAVFGTGRPFLSAVIVAPDGSPESIDDELAKINQTLPQYLRIRANVVTTERFTSQNGLLSNREKVNRGAVWARYQDALQALYNE